MGALAVGATNADYPVGAMVYDSKHNFIGEVKSATTVAGEVTLRENAKVTVAKDDVLIIIKEANKRTNYGVVYKWTWDGSKFIQDKTTRAQSHDNNMYGYQLFNYTSPDNLWFELFGDSSHLAVVPVTKDEAKIAFIKGETVTEENILKFQSKEEAFEDNYPASIEFIHFNTDGSIYVNNNRPRSYTAGSKHNTTHSNDGLAIVKEKELLTAIDIETEYEFCIKNGAVNATTDLEIVAIEDLVKSKTPANAEHTYSSFAGADAGQFKVTQKNGKNILNWNNNTTNYPVLTPNGLRRDTGKDNVYDIDIKFKGVNGEEFTKKFQVKAVETKSDGAVTDIALAITDSNSFEHAKQGSDATRKYKLSVTLPAAHQADDATKKLSFADNYSLVDIKAWTSNKANEYEKEFDLEVDYTANIPYVAVAPAGMIKGTEFAGSHNVKSNVEVKLSE